MNTKLLRQVRAEILKYPENYDQGEWDPTKCACCIVAKAIKLAGRTKEMSDGGWKYRALAMEVLGLPSSDEYSALFDLYEWPDPFYTRYSEAGSARERALAAADRITHFIKTKGAE